MSGKEHRFEWEIQIWTALLATALLTLGFGLPYCACIGLRWQPPSACVSLHMTMCERDRLVEMAEYHAILWKTRSRHINWISLDYKSAHSPEAKVGHEPTNLQARDPRPCHSNQKSMSTLPACTVGPHWAIFIQMCLLLIKPCQWQMSLWLCEFKTLLHF